MSYRTATEVQFLSNQSHGTQGAKQGNNILLLFIALSFVLFNALQNYEFCGSSTFHEY